MPYAPRFARQPGYLAIVDFGEGRDFSLLGGQYGANLPTREACLSHQLAFFSPGVVRRVWIVEARALRNWRPTKQSLRDHTPTLGVDPDYVA